MIFRKKVKIRVLAKPILFFLSIFLFSNCQVWSRFFPDKEISYKPLPSSIQIEFRLAKTKRMEGYSKSYQEAPEQFLFLADEAGLTNKDILGASLYTDSMNQEVVGIAFNQEGTQKFAKLTRENIKERLAILINGRVTHVPFIMEEITRGEVLINIGHSPSVEETKILKLFKEAL